MSHPVRKIVSGGQTGADRAALDFAISAGIDYGGWIPKGRTDEFGTIPLRYANLIESSSPDPAERTRLNVRDSDGTVILSVGPLHGGSLLTQCAAIELGRPVIHLDLSTMSEQDAAQVLRNWIKDTRIRVLNVAGPRQSQQPQIYDAVRSVMTRAFTSRR